MSQDFYMCWGITLSHTLRSEVTIFLSLWQGKLSENFELQNTKTHKAEKRTQ